MGYWSVGLACVQQARHSRSAAQKRDTSAGVSPTGRWTKVSRKVTKRALTPVAVFEYMLQVLNVTVVLDPEM